MAADRYEPSGAEAVVGAILTLPLMALDGLVLRYLYDIGVQPVFAKAPSIGVWQAALLALPLAYITGGGEDNRSLLEQVFLHLFRAGTYALIGCVVFGLAY